MSAQGVYTNELRVTFVDGQETPTPDVGFVACGAGTGFPMEVTGANTREKFDKIAEIMYRVKDAWFTAGSLRVFEGSAVVFQGVPSSRVKSLIERRVRAAVKTSGVTIFSRRD